MPVVLAGVGKGCGIDAEAPDCERDWDMGTEDCGDFSEDGAVKGITEAPLGCEFMDE